MAAKGHRDRALRRAKKRPLLKARDIGVHAEELTRFVRSGALERVARGIYRSPESPVTEHHAFAVVAVARPHSVICLLSALSFHGIGTQLPFEVWVAVRRGSRPPSMRNPPVRVVRMSGKSFEAGIEAHRIEGERVRIFSPAKTIADLFKFRKRIGIDVAIEALRDAWQRRLITIADVERYARICRVDRVMAPYIEALVA